MRRAVWLIKEELLLENIIMPFRAEALGRETQLYCLFQNTDFRLTSNQNLCTRDSFTIFAKGPLISQRLNIFLVHSGRSAGSTGS